MTATPEARAGNGTKGRGARPGPLMVLVSSALLCALLLLVFRNLASGSLRSGEDENAAGASVARAPAYEGGSGATASLHVATLLRLHGRVEVRYAGSPAWTEARPDLALHGGDAVQAARRASALLRLEANDHLELGERSLIVFDAGIADRFAGGAFARRGTLLEGSISGTLGGAQGDAVPFELAVAGGALMLTPAAAAGGEVRFHVSRNPDETTSIALFSGRALYAPAGGTAQTILDGSALTVDAGGQVVARGPLAKAPAPAQPAADAEVAYRDVPPRIAFAWQPVGAAERYRLRVARDREMTDIVLDERVAGTSFTLSDLHAGDHWWSVSALDGWNEGHASAARRLRITRDARPPVLVLEEIPPFAADDGSIVVRGRTEPGARVYVQGDVVATAADGSFATVVEVPPGASLVVVEAADAVGNVAYRSQIVSPRAAERPVLAGTDIE